MARSSLNRSNCVECLTNLVNKNVKLTDKNEILIFYKLYPNIKKTDATIGLIAPSQTLYNVVNKCIDIFQQHFDECMHQKKVKKRLFKKMKRKIAQWLLETDECYNHKKLLIEHLIKTKIYRICKEISSKKRDYNKKKRKLNILTNS